VPYVFFNTVPLERLKTLPGNVYFVFNSATLLNRKFGINQKHTEGLPEKYKYKISDPYKLTKKLRHVYDKSIESTQYVDKQFQNITYLLFQEIYVKGKVDFNNLEFIVLNRRIGNDQIEKIQKLLQDFPDVHLEIADSEN